MENEKSRLCVIKDGDYKNQYIAEDYSSKKFLRNAKIFKEEEIPEGFKNTLSYPIIYLDSAEGLELIVNEIEYLNGLIKEAEKDLEEMKGEKKKLYNTNCEIIDDYFRVYNPRARIRKINNEEKRTILEKIFSKNKKSKNKN